MKLKKTTIIITLLVIAWGDSVALAESKQPKTIDEMKFLIYQLKEDVLIDKLTEQYGISLSEFNVLNNTDYILGAVIPAGKTVKVKEKNKGHIQNKTMVVDLPELASINEDSVIGDLVAKTPISSYMSENYEANLANTVKFAAEEDWSKLSGKALAKQSEEYLLNQIKTEVNQKINQEASGILGKFGKAEVNISIDTDGNIESGSLSVLSPLYDKGQDLIFSQVGIHEQGSGNEKRLIGNFGLGYRYDMDTWLLGANAFIDHDFTGSNTRLGLGGELWMDYLKIASNIYTPLSNWKESEVMKEYESLIYDERPAKGFDIRAQGYLPSHPNLGGSLVFEQYFGDEVALFSTKERQKDPYAFTFGIDYTPIPLITADIAHKMGKGSKEDTRLGLNLNLQLGTPIEKQLDASNVAQSRSLKGSRYDIVDRNYDIVFEYKQEDFFVQIEGPTSGQINQIAQFTALYQSRSDIKDFSWVLVSPNGIRQTPKTQSGQSGKIFNFTPMMPGKYQIALQVTTERNHVATSNVIDFTVELNSDYQSSLVWANGSSQAEVITDIHLSDVVVLALPLDKALRMDFLVKNQEGNTIEIDDPELLWRWKDASSQWSIFDAESLNQGIRAVPEMLLDAEGKKYWRFHVIANELFENKEVEFLAKSKTNIDYISRNVLEGAFIPQENLMFNPENIVIEIHELKNSQSTYKEGAQLITRSGYENKSLVSYQQPREIFVNKAYEVVVLHKDDITGAQEDITAYVEHSIRWSYINPYTGEAFYDNEHSSILQSCNGKPVIHTQITNYEDNEFAYGDAVKQGIDLTVINEQQLKLAARINFKQIQDPWLAKQGKGRVCGEDLDGLFHAQNGYIGFLGETQEERIASIDNLRSGEWK